MTAFPNARSSTVAPNLALSVAALVGSLAPAAVLLFLGQPAEAQTAPAARAAEIRIELQAKSPEAVHREIATAARQVCEAVTVRSPLTPRDLTRCRTTAETEAMAQINPPVQLAARD